MNLPPLPEPDAYLFQHDETGQTMFVDSQQVEWGFEKNNPRLHKIGGAFTEKQLQDYARQARRDAVAATVPEGWKLVPIEPTEEMFFDPDDVCVNFKETPWSAFIRIYRTLLAASPEVKP